MKSAFRFKQFSIYDNACAMKLGADSVLLGGLTETQHSLYVLDIGTGCGILALMLAQKSNALIDAVEIEASASHQAFENFEQSKWSERIKIYHDSIQEYSDKCSRKYECIVCNPPYFQGYLKSPDENKNFAKHNTYLNFDELSICVKKLLSENGLFWAIIPVSEKNNFQKAFLNSGLYCRKIINIFDKPEKEPHRIVFCFSTTIPETTENKSLYIKNSDSTPSKAFIELTKDFYINF